MLPFLLPVVIMLLSAVGGLFSFFVNRVSLLLFLAQFFCPPQYKPLVYKALTALFLFRMLT